MRAYLIAWLLVAAAACGDNPGSGPKDAAQDAPADAGPPDADCFENPTTHEEIINACTTAQKITKEPDLPLQLPDGGLPPVP